MPTMKLDGREVEFNAGESVIQVCDREGVEIPRFCYHDRLKIAGNCRMCLVEVKPGPPKPQASCALPAAPNMEVFTNTPMVKKAREGVMEFLLINHPLDCPICDQGGECDLQDEAMAYGKGTSRYHDPKRAVEEKNMGPLVKTTMTRCIHCTRCVRFVDEVAGVPEIGALGRGEHMEITSYLARALTSELSGNIIDLCPVGALTSKPYAFNARPWELSKTESIDVLDAVGSNIRIDARGEVVLRILPRLNEEVNEEWLADKARFACDGLKTQRLDRPYVRKDGKLVEVDWEEALGLVAEKMKAAKPSEIAAIAGNLMDVEAMVTLKDLMKALGSPHLECRQDGAKIDVADRASYLMNTGIANLEKADVALFIGTNPRHEAPLVNTRLRKAYLANGMQAFNVGAAFDLTFPVQQLGENPQVLAEIAAGKHPVAEALKNAKNPVIVLGAGALARGDGAEILKAAKAIADTCKVVREGWNGFNMLHHAAARVGALDIGFVPQAKGHDMAGIIEAVAKKAVKLVYLLGVDEIDMGYFGGAFVVYQGHHGDIGAHRADVVLPGAAYTEKNALYVNTEGRVQETRRAIFPPGQAREDWQIVAALAAKLGKKPAYATQAQLRARIIGEFASFAVMDARVAATWKVQTDTKPAIKAETFDYPIHNFYMSDPISRSSKTMAQCTESLRATREEKAA
ncbi:MAG: NADH-quinone oxidoreductase subunit NuoG [Alphaproteobacteria bacterium]|nr:NADH-quinone oxidoreductase subunit NuoG [Alphaproteobacteria bacterium]